MSFWIVGGDLRQVKLAELLLEDGHRVQTYAMASTWGGAFPAQTICPRRRD